MNNKLIRILPVAATIAIMIAIFLFSSQNSVDSSEVSSSLIRQIIDTVPFTAHASEARKLEIVEYLHNFVRKCAHFTIYTSLGFSFCASLIANAANKKRPAIWLCTIVFCCVYAATDEFHQTFVSGRSGEIRDVLLDTSGGATGAGIFLLRNYVYLKIKNKRRYGYD